MVDLYLEVLENDNSYLFAEQKNPHQRIRIHKVVKGILIFYYNQAG